MTALPDVVGKLVSMSSNSEDGRPSGRWAVVSGGGTGIGRATVLRLAADGFRVVAVGRRPEPLAAVVEAAAASGHQVVARVADSSDPEAVTGLVAAVAELTDTVTAVVANAGASVIAPGDGLAGVADQWNAAFRANTLSSVLLTIGFEPLLARPGGRIVLIGSRAASSGGSSAAYVATKAALQGWVLELAKRLGPQGITANVVAPGFVAGTELVAGRISPEREARIMTGIALGRAGTPEEIAATVAHLVGVGGGFCNGQVLVVDGGAVPTS